EDDRGGHALALEAEILGVNVATDGGAQLAALAPEDMPRIAPEPEEQMQPPEPELQPEPTGTDARELSAVGIKLGMPLEEAAAALTDVAETIYHAKVTPADPKLVQDRYAFFVLDNAETFALHTADAPGEPVIGVARRIPVGDDVPADTIRAAFVDKYGAPTLTEGSGERASWRWEPVSNRSAADVSCVAHFSNAMGSGQLPIVSEKVKDVDAISRVFDGASMWAQSDDNSFFSYYMKDRAPRIGLDMEDRLGDCAAFLHIDFVPSQTHANYIRVYLVDAAAFEVELEAAGEEGGAGAFDSKL
ncbi:hypothetical protein, partial [Halomonas jincaotanensis]|uniref:hypothetical protein n=1 Tax=Halomonas jincaotanensis TaxID=2810616 RepID=UPI002022D144